MAKKKRVKAKRALIRGIIILVVIIAAVCGAYFMWPKTMNKQAATPEETVNNIVTKATSGTNNDNQEAAQKELRQLAKDSSNDKEKVTYLIGLRDLYMEQNDSKNVYETALTIETLTEQSVNAALIAGYFRSTADYKNAAKYYGIAASRTEKSNDPNERSSYNAYTALKTEMEAMIK